MCVAKCEQSVVGVEATFVGMLRIASMWCIVPIDKNKLQKLEHILGFTQNEQSP